jgi:hypothetical protein
MTLIYAAEAIASVIGYDMAEMSDYRYQRSKYASPAIYCTGSAYFAAPVGNRPPKYDDRWDWKPCGEWKGRKVWTSE